jgi:hypothetical protein
MTLTHRLKNELVGYLLAVRPSTSLEVVDATQTSEMNPPTLAVEVGAPEAHSTALAHVQRCPIEIKLRLHAGDAPDYDASDWIDQIEDALDAPDNIKNVINDQLAVDYWLYGGSSQEWDESIVETTFTAECLCYRI